MRFISALIVVSDMAASRRFYEEVLRQKVLMDYGENVVFEGFCLQTKFLELMEREDLLIRTQPNDHELYFEEDDLDGFLAHLEQFPDLDLLHGMREEPWGQRGIRFYDPDFHIIEVAESMAQVVRRLHAEGMGAEDIAEKTMQTMDFVLRQTR